MEIRTGIKPYIGMDDLERPWESENKLIMEPNNLPKPISKGDIVAFIKSAKYQVIEMYEPKMKLERKKDN